MTRWLYLIGSISLEVTATMALKGALEHPWLYAVVAASYIGAFAMLAVVLRLGMSIGVAYGIWGAAGVALTAILSMIIFGEPLTLLMSIGIVLVIGGVLAVELGAQHAHRTAQEVK